MNLGFNTSRMNTWTYVRGVLILLSAAGAFFEPLEPRAIPPIGWQALLEIFAFCPIAITSVVGFQVLNPRSAKIWRRPSWKINPFNLREPLQFFHFAACASLAQGTVVVARLAFSPKQFYFEALVPLIMAVGVFLGIRLVMILFNKKMEAG